MNIDVSHTLPVTDMEIVLCLANQKIKDYDLILSHQEYMLIVEPHAKKIFLGLQKEINDHEIVLAIRSLYAKTGVQWPEKLVLRFLGIEIDLKSIARGLFLTRYNLGRYKTDKADPPKGHVIYLEGGKEEQNQIRQAEIEAEAQMWAMQLVDTPPDEKCPEAIGREVTTLGKSAGFEVEVWDKAAIDKNGLNALSAVGRGSSRPPVFIHCKYEGKSDSGETDLVLLGKGISFDTGGISIKPSKNLHYMKSDMAGAAVVLATIASIAQMKIPVNLSVVVVSAENNVGTEALLPGEVIRSYSGKTIEVIDTDAEGRLVLADALAWAVKHLKPGCMIDCATLTGSAVRALGNEAAALFSSDQELSSKLYNAGQETGEKLWPMPLWKDYDHYLDSDIADVSNLSSKPVAGSIAAAKFLEVFTDGHPRWAHIDMPGVSFRDNPSAKTKSATGFGVQLLTHYIIDHFN